MTADGGPCGDGGPAVAADGLWEDVDRLLVRLGPDGASGHGFGPLEARRLRLRGEPVPEQLAREERVARTSSLFAPALLARVRGAYDGDLMLLKGPELASRYPDRARRFADLDLLPAEPERAQAALLAAGFRPQEGIPPYDYGRHHHLHPLECPGLALRIEIHRQVLWPAGLPVPRNEELFEAAGPASGGGLEGVVVPYPDHHALLLAAHLWGDTQLRKLRELVDVLVFTDDAARERLSRLARHWSFERGWRSTLATADWLLRGSAEPRFVGVWGRYLRELREPTVFELHLQEMLSPFSFARLPAALRLAAAAATRNLRPAPYETWQDKALRAGRALRRPLEPRSEHEARWGKHI